MNVSGENMSDKKIELLAPAGTLECGLAAFNYGADAVYLGMKLFSARADAGNFSTDDLRTLLGVAHPAGRKVYVAVNTLVRESELPDLIELLCDLRNLGVDGLIVQDAALRGLVNEYFPEFELHASTQMSVHNVEGVREARRLGYARVVAARELSMRELTELCAVPGVEIEAFIHGALCYSYSGLCLLSACLNGASGNRGDCTYVCRGKFRMRDPRGKDMGMCCPFSMKDLAAGDLLNAMRKAGVASLKIEGRKKTPLYVAAVTNYYRRLLDGTFEPGGEGLAEQDVKTIFSRPWTHFFMDNVRQPDVTDTATVGPRGVEVGQVGRVNDGFLRFEVRRHAIEKHDGLQVEIPGVSRPYGFGVDEIREFTQRGGDRWSRVFVAEPGKTVEIPLPDGHPELPVGSRICRTSSQDVRRRYSWPEARPALCRQRRNVDFRLDISADCISVIADAGSGIVVEMSRKVEEGLSPARDVSAVDVQVRDAFSRLGDTGLIMGKLEISNPGGLFVPKSMLNELRRCAADEIADVLESENMEYFRKVKEVVEGETLRKIEDVAPAFSVKIDHAYYLNMIPQEKLNRLEEVVFAIDRTRPDELEDVLANLAKKLGGRDRIRISVPVIVRPAVRHDYAPVVRKLFDGGWRRWEIGNLGGLDILRRAGGSASLDGMDVTADWSLYAFNHVAAGEWFKLGIRRVTMCPEDTFDNQDTLAAKLGGRITAVLFQEPVLARSAVCAMASAKGQCPGQANCSFTEMDMTSVKGEHIVAVNDKCTSILLGDPMGRIDDMQRLASLGVRHFRADFLWQVGS